MAVVATAQWHESNWDHEFVLSEHHAIDDIVDGSVASCHDDSCVLGDVLHLSYVVERASWAGCQMKVNLGVLALQQILQLLWLYFLLARDWVADEQDWL